MAIEWRGGSLAASLNGIATTMAKAVSAGIAGATDGAKTELRRQLTGSGYHFDRAANAIRGDVYPRPPAYSPRAAGSVYAAGDVADRMFSAFAAGAIVTPNKRHALAVPLHDARGFGSQRSLLGPGSTYFGGKLVFLPFRNHVGPAIGLLASPVDAFFKSRLRRSKGRARFAAKTPAHLVPQFLLLDAAVMPKILSPEDVMSNWLDRLPDLVQQAANILDR